MEYQKRAVAFIDILGWRDMVDESINHKDLRDKMENAITGMGNIVRKQVEEEDDPHMAEYGLLPSADQASQFSDSIVISYLFNHAHDLTRLIRELTSYQLIMLQMGFLVRGGITVGDMFHQESIAFGPALNRAVSLEGKAEFPRVVIDDSLNFCVEELAKQFPAHWAFVRKDEDGLYSTDYLTQIALSPASTAFTEFFIEKQLTRFAGNLAVFPKYRWLSEKLAHAVVDAGWRRNIINKHHDLMQSQ